MITQTHRRHSFSKSVGWKQRSATWHVASAQVRTLGRLGHFHRKWIPRARRSVAEHFFGSVGLRKTATGWLLGPVDVPVRKQPSSASQPGFPRKRRRDQSQHLPSPERQCVYVPLRLRRKTCAAAFLCTAPSPAKEQHLGMATQPAKTNRRLAHLIGATACDCVPGTELHKT